MKLYRCLVILLLAGFVACSDSTGPDGGSSGNNGESMVIDDTGGTLAADSAEIIVPPGAFSSDVELTLSEDDEQVNGESIVSKTYRLDGMPDDVGEPIQLRVKYTGTLENESYIAVGTLEPEPDEDNSRYVYSYYPATASGEYLHCTLPSTSVIRKGADKTGRVGQSIGEEVVLSFFGLSNYQTQMSSGNHYYIRYPLKVIERIPSLDTALGEVYSIYNNMGFNFQVVDRTWLDIDKIDVTVKPFLEYYKDRVTTIGTPSHRKYDDEQDFEIDINQSKFESLDMSDIKIAIGRSFFSFIMFASDPAYSYNLRWFRNAGAVWSENLFANNANYISPDFVGNEMRPLQGLRIYQWKDWKEERAYGYGMSALIEYLCDDSRYGKQLLPKILGEVRKGTTSASAIIDAIDDYPNVWWPDFIKTYIAGDIYNVSDETFINAPDGVYSIASHSDTLHTFSEEYNGFSARLFRINLEYADIDTTSTITFTVDNSSAEVMVYGIKNNKLEYFDSAAELTVTNIRDLSDAGYDMMAAVVYSGYNDDYSHTGTVNLRVELDAAEIPELEWEYYDYCRVSTYYFKCYYSNGESSDLCNHSWAGYGEWDGSTYRVSGSSSLNETTFTTHITVNVDFEQMVVTSFTADYIMESDDFMTSYSLYGEEIPLMKRTDDYHSLEFDIRGEQTAEHITQYTYDSESDYYSYNLASFECVENTGIRIHIFHYY